MTVTMARLTNGELVQRPYVDQTIMHLEDLARAHGIVPLYELRELCKNPGHTPFGLTGKHLHDFGLLTSWEPKSGRAEIHGLTRAVALAALVGDDLNISVSRDIIVSVEEVDE